MDIETIIAEIRGRCPLFAGRVAGSAQFKNLQQNTNVQVPCAFVMPLDDEPEEQRAKSGYRQDLRDAVAVVVAVSNEADERGQGAVVQVRKHIRAELFRCLLGWKVSDDYDGLIYEGGSLIGVDRARLWYQFEFSAMTTIGEGETRLQANFDALPPFEGVSVGVDFINPGPPGPDGNIELQVSLDPPQT